MSTTKSVLFLVLLLLSSNLIQCWWKTNLSKRMKKLETKIEATIKKAEIEAANRCNKGMGINGHCLNTVTGVSSLPLSGDAKEVVNGWVFPIITAATGASSMCVGDYKGSYITDGAENLGSYNCPYIPLETNFTYGVIGAIARNVIGCGENPVSPALCIAFDDCGTVAFLVNGDLVQCASTYSTGIAAVFSAVSDTLNYSSIAFSLDKKLTKTFDIAYMNDNSVSSKSVTTKGHFYFGLGLTFPMKWLKINGKSLEDFLSFDIDLILLIDLGDVGTIVSSSINTLKNANSSNAKSIVNSIVYSGAELTAILSGSITIGFEKLTNGFLQNFSVTVAQTNLLFSAGHGSSGMKAGMYIYFTSDIVSSLLSSFENVYDHFASILGYMGFKKPSLGNTSISLGLFVETGYLGFKFSFPGFSAQCLFNTSQNKGSCSFHDTIFTAIAKAGKWIIKQAKTLFDETGSEIVSVAQGIGKFAEDSAKAVANLASTIGNDISNTASNVGNDISNTASNVGNDISNTASNVGNDISSGASSVIHSISKW